ncbi:MAG TPA: cob(I)yrinic acid a,c-diamide adenosyltransferase [Chryseolinea sp.]|nr:cob(I)yrinic acid a,c-diamide adenosyltransferase [Chryseolinea sp.]
MKIYTKTGDQGYTSLFGGTRLSKAAVRIESYGTVDELNSFLGLVRDLDVNATRKEILIGIQEKLFTIGAVLASEPGNVKVKIPQLFDADTEFIEKEIDRMEASLPPLRSFILPGGHPAISHCHIARTVCRRAERLVILLSEQESVDPQVIKYLNRLSDYLFVLSRTVTQELGVEETPWKPTT